MDNESCRKLIKLYGTKEVLWNTKSSSYHNKSLRQDAWTEISREMGVPAPELKKKITVLQSSYRREKWRIAKSQTTGSGRDSIYISKWFGFDDFSFMQDKCTPNCTTDTLQDNGTDTADVTQESTSQNEGESSEKTSDECNTQVQFNDILQKAPEKTTKKRKQEEEDKMLTEAFKILTEPSQATDPYFSYGQHIANELRKYDSHTLIYVKQAINNVIFEADLGKYSPHYGYTTQEPQNLSNSNIDSLAGTSTQDN